LKRIFKYTAAILAISILGALIGAGIATYRIGNVFLTPAKMIQEHTFSAWKSTAWKAYYEEKPEIALWAAERFLEYYENDYPTPAAEDLEWGTRLDIMRMYTKAAILSEVLGKEDAYRMYIEKALALAKSSDEEVFNKFVTEADLINHEKEWERVTKLKGVKHNQPVKGETN